MERAVVKLGLLIKGEEAVFRRFSWDEVLLDVSVMSLLSSNALSLYRGLISEKAKEALAAEDYFVSFHYYDTDNDKVVIWTESDVLNALNEYSTIGRRLIRIFAQVQEKHKDKTFTESVTSVKARRTTTGRTKEKGTETEATKVADIFADLLSIAVVSVEAGVNAALSKKLRKATRQVSKDHYEAAKAAAKDGFRAAIAAHRAGFMQARNSVHSVVKAGTDAAVASIAAVHLECPRDCTASVAKDHVTPTEANPAVYTEAAPLIPDRVFIHGRHTCDLCLTRPIVGKRFHATNLHDYDLCEACHSNYKGSEIKFEEARLDRDVPSQERWKRKRAIQQAMKSCYMRHASYGLHQAPPPLHYPFGPPHRKASLHTVRHTHAVPPPFGYPPHSPPSFHGNPPPYGPPHPSLVRPTHISHNPCGTNDTAFEEAIRRSIQDVAVREQGKKEPYIVDGLRTLVENAVVVKVEDDEIFSDCKEAPEDDLELAGVKKPADDDKGAANGDAKTNFEEVKTDEVAMDRSVDTEIVEVKKTKSVQERVVKTVSDEVKSVEENIAHLSNDYSFASDAVGSGDIAAFVGETLDRMGEAIEDLHNFNFKTSKAARLDEGGVEDFGDSGSKGFYGDDDLASEGSWSIVVEDVEDVEEGVGRAAKAIGPALFESDMRVNENVSALTHSIDESSSSSGSNHSSVNSMPTDVHADDTTDVVQVQLERWDIQMEQP